LGLEWGTALRVIGFVALVLGMLIDAVLIAVSVAVGTPTLLIIVLALLALATVPLGVLLLRGQARAGGVVAFVAAQLVATLGVALLGVGGLIDPGRAMTPAPRHPAFFVVVQGRPGDSFLAQLDDGSLRLCEHGGSGCAAPSGSGPGEEWYPGPNTPITIDDAVIIVEVENNTDRPMHLSGSLLVEVSRAPDLPAGRVRDCRPTILRADPEVVEPGRIKALDLADSSSTISAAQLLNNAPVLAAADRLTYKIHIGSTAEETVDTCGPARRYRWTVTSSLTATSASALVSSPFGTSRSGVVALWR
jgi:hypothetical protein